MSARRIEAVGVVVPARDEEQLLPACLDALADASEQLAVVDPATVHVVVVLDSCTDRSADVVAARPWAHTVVVDNGNVGMSRGAGVRRVLELAAGVPDDRLWLATTDADSRVPVDWLSGQLALAAGGARAVVGTVVVDDWSEHPAEVETLHDGAYRAVERHRHVHGANLGCRADALLGAGGWPPLAVHEDVALLTALTDVGVVRTARLPVVTSARRDPRAPGGFGDTLRGLVG